MLDECFGASVECFISFPSSKAFALITLSHRRAEAASRDEGVSKA